MDPRAVRHLGVQIPTPATREASSAPPQATALLGGTEAGQPAAPGAVLRWSEDHGGRSMGLLGLAPHHSLPPPEAQPLPGTHRVLNSRTTVMEYAPGS